MANLSRRPGTRRWTWWPTALRRSLKANGPDALAFLSSAKCTNEENYLVQKLSRGVIGTNNVDHCARL